jgi:hypothetical protein
MGDKQHKKLHNNYLLIYRQSNLSFKKSTVLICSWLKKGTLESITPNHKHMTK